MDKADTPSYTMTSAHHSRVAQNLLGSSDESLSSEECTTVRLLLENCIRLLGDEKSQVSEGLGRDCSGRDDCTSFFLRL